MSDRNNDQELEKTTDATADEATSETETNDAIESVPADSMQFSVTFDDVDDEGTVDDGIYSALASAETGETDETSEAEADAIASANASAEVTERNAARVNETLRLAKTDHKDALAEHAEPQGKASEPTMTLASRIDRVLVGGGSDDILLKTYPTFALNKVTVAGPKGKVQHPRWREFLLLFRTRIRAADQRRPRFGHHRRRQTSRADGRDERFGHAGVWHGDEQERQHC